MRGLVAAVALAVSGLAQAQIIGTNAQAGWPPGTMPMGQLSWASPTPVARSTALASALFGGGCLGTGTAGTSGAPVTVWRTSSKPNLLLGTGSCEASFGSSLGEGMLVEAAGTFHSYDSDSLNTVNWTAFGTVPVTADQYVAPDGTLSGDKVAANAGAWRYQLGVTMSNTAGPVTVEGYVRSDTGTATGGLGGQCNGGTVNACACSVTPPLTCTATTSTDKCFATSTVSTSWAFLASTYSCAAATTGHYALVSPGYPGAGTAGYWRVGIKEGLPSTPIPVVVTTKTVAADAVTMVSPVASNTWCVKTRVTSAWGAPWGIAARTLWTLGTTDAANSAKLIATTGGSLAFSVYNGSATVKTFTATHSFTAGSEHLVTACNVAGTLTLYNGAASLSGANSGAGDGVLAAYPLGFFIGSGSAEGTETSLAFKSFCVEPTFSSKECPSATSSYDIPAASRYVWQGMDKAKRTHIRGLTSWPFKWTSDPSLRADLRRRTASLGSTTWTADIITVNVPSDYDTLNGGMQWRDGSVWYDRKAKRYFYAISSIGPQANPIPWSTDRWSVFSSADGKTWDFVTYVIPSGANANWRVWTPEVFVEDDGTVYVVVSYAESNTRGFKLKLYRAEDPGTFRTWTDLGDIAGSAFRLGSNSEIDYHDAMIIKRSGTYHLIARCASTAGTCVAGEVDRLTSASLQTGYNTRAVVQRSGPVTLVAEGMAVLELDDGTFRLFFDDFAGICAGQLCYLNMATLAAVGSAPISAVGDADYPNRNTNMLPGL